MSSDIDSQQNFGISSLDTQNKRYKITDKEKDRVENYRETRFTLNAENIFEVPIEELNSSLIRTIQVLHKKDFTFELFNIAGLNKDGRQVLSKIREHFTNKKIDSTEMTQLIERDQALLALGLTLQCLEKSIFDPYVDGKFVPYPSAELAGVTFKVSGESKRDRFGFFVQQDNKYQYRLDNSEAAHFFLIHTTTEDQKDELTTYERIQSDNFEKAREYIRTNLEPRKRGHYSAQDAIAINKIILKGLVPERNFGQLRRTENVRVGDRIKTTDPERIPINLLDTMILATSKVSSARMGIIEEPMGVAESDEPLFLLAKEWAIFDAIHPMEEGNGRTEFLIFESLYRFLYGMDKQIASERKDSPKLVKAINTALTIETSNSNQGFDRADYERFIITKNLVPLVEYIKSHTVTM